MLNPSLIRNKQEVNPENPSIKEESVRLFEECWSADRCAKLSPPPKVKPPELSLFPLFPNSWKLHLCKFAKKRNEQILSSIFPTSPSSRGGQQRQKQNRRTWLHSHSHTHSQSSRPATRRAKIASSLLRVEPIHTQRDFEGSSQCASNVCQL